MNGWECSILRRKGSSSARVPRLESTTGLRRLLISPSASVAGVQDCDLNGDPELSNAPSTIVKMTWRGGSIRFSLARPCFGRYEVWEPTRPEKTNRRRELSFSPPGQYRADRSRFCG